MIRNIGAAALAVFLTGAALADITFDFQDAQYTGADDVIGAYMSNIYGSSVTTYGTHVGRDLGFGDCSNQYLWSDNLWSLAPAVEINFNEESISGLSFDGHIFLASYGADFRLQAFCGDEKVFDGGVNAWSGYSFTTPWIEFDAPVDRLIFSNNFIHSIGVDNLTVRKCTDGAVPAPTAVGLGFVGLAAIAWMKRQDAVSTQNA